jgi:hypothetical protein
MNRPAFAACLIIGCINSYAVFAQEPVTAETLYAGGVQAYFRGCSTDAESLFSRLAGADPNDPRAFYFRALSLMQQGRVDEARSDMEIGAQIEARVPARFDIGKTLERVQGPNRLLLEQYRSRARQIAMANPPLGSVRAPDTGVIRERRIVPLDEFSRQGEPQSFIAPQAPPETFAPRAPATTRPVPSPPAASPEASGNPFGDDTTATPTSKTQPKAPPAKATPKTPPAAAPIPPQPQPTPPATKPAEDKQENPFQ